MNFAEGKGSRECVLATDPNVLNYLVSKTYADSERKRGIAPPKKKRRVVLTRIGDVDT